MGTTAGRLAYPRECHHHGAESVRPSQLLAILDRAEMVFELGEPAIAPDRLQDARERLRTMLEAQNAVLDRVAGTYAADDQELR